MTATPLAMSFCSHPYAAAAFVIEWHVVGMYAPGFFTGSLIQRFGALKVILVGAALVVVCIAIAVGGNDIGHFWGALVLLGVGWNLMYTGGTTLLTEAHSVHDKAKTQGLNDFIVFAVMSISSISSGALVDAAGWERMNTVALPFVAIVAIATLWLMAHRRRAAAMARAKAM
jgi:MFS family permease